MPDHLDTLDLAALTREAERLGFRSGDHGVWWDVDERDLLAARLRWLLRQPEAQARAACYARGVADERARVVAAGRQEATACLALDPCRASVLDDLADALERGEHEVTRG